MRGREGQRTSPVSQCCTFKWLLNCWSSILEDKTCERENYLLTQVREFWGSIRLLQRSTEEDRYLPDKGERPED